MISFKINVDEYINHPYNNTIENERSIEIPIAIRYYNKYHQNEDFIEIGCVLPHYINSTKHHVIDPVDPKATNSNQAQKICYNNRHVLSISTIEHIGTGDYGLPRLSDNTSYWLLKKIYNESKSCLISWPLGYNKKLDIKVLQDDALLTIFFKKIALSKWIQTNKENVIECRYNSPFKFGNGLVWVYKF